MILFLCIVAFLALVALFLISISLHLIATALETVIDRDKQAVRMFDTERANVYLKHLGKELKAGDPKP